MSKLSSMQHKHVRLKKIEEHLGILAYPRELGLELETRQQEVIRLF